MVQKYMKVLWFLLTQTGPLYIECPNLTNLSINSYFDTRINHLDLLCPKLLSLELSNVSFDNFQSNFQIEKLHFENVYQLERYSSFRKLLLSQFELKEIEGQRIPLELLNQVLLSLPKLTTIKFGRYFNYQTFLTPQCRS